MQGRLSKPVQNQIQTFPQKSWKNEFVIAKELGFELIEFVFDSLDNPIMNDKGIEEIEGVLDNSGITINSLCADYFMQNLLFDLPEEKLEKNFNILNQLINQCSKIGINIIELPFVDSSSLLQKNSLDKLISNLKKVIPSLENHNIHIALETDLPPVQFVGLLNKFNSSFIGANYDVGNSIYKGYNPVEEINTLNKFIENIHVKDRKFNGPTVPLGIGDVNFDEFFRTLSNIGYSKDFIIQGAREDLSGSVIEPKQTCSKYLKFVKNFMEKY